MVGTESYRQFIKRVERSPEYAAEAAALEFADALSRAMQQAGIDVAQLADRSGLSLRQLSAVLRGDAKITATLIDRIAASFAAEARAELLQSSPGAPERGAEAP